MTTQLVQARSTAPTIQPQPSLLKPLFSNSNSLFISLLNTLKPALKSPKSRDFNPNTPSVIVAIANTIAGNNKNNIGRGGRDG